MTHPDGGFYSAEDADSEGHEGKFYCWTQDELSRLLSPEEFNVATRHFGITRQGNFVDHSHPSPLPGQNVLSVVEPIARPDGGGGEGGDQGLLASAKAKMLEARNARVRPHRDDKVLASWNGLMLGAFARAYGVLGDAKYLAAAEANVAFIRNHLWVTGKASCVEAGRPAEAGTPSDLGPAEAGTPSGHGVGALYHRWRDGERDEVQLLQGYAFLLEGVIQLYEVTLQPAHLDFATRLAESMIARFYDSGNGGFWQSTADANDLILRFKDEYDGAEPSGNSVATAALLKLAAITGREAFRLPAEATLRLFAGRLEKVPQAMACLLQGVDYAIEEPRRVVITGEPGDEKVRELLLAAHGVYQPNKVVLGSQGAVDPFARSLATRPGPMAYLCTGTACQPPTSDAAVLGRLVRL
jgi:uncharacterized protein